jgi:hypothetical protein
MIAWSEKETNGQGHRFDTKPVVLPASPPKLAGDIRPGTGTGGTAVPNLLGGAVPPAALAALLPKKAFHSAEPRFGVSAMIIRPPFRVVGLPAAAIAPPSACDFFVS